MLSVELTSEIKLQINQRLYDKRLITKEVYEEAKLRIVAETKCYKEREQSIRRKSEIRQDIPAF